MYIKNKFFPLILQPKLTLAEDKYLLVFLCNCLLTCLYNIYSKIINNNMNYIWVVNTTFRLFMPKRINIDSTYNECFLHLLCTLCANVNPECTYDFLKNDNC